MNIHEHQAKDILKEYGAPVSQGIVIFSESEIEEKIKNLKSQEVVLKAQIHAGGRGKAGGVKLLKNDKIIEGNPDKIKFVTDNWKFTKNINNKSPNWYLSEIIS